MGAEQAREGAFDVLLVDDICSFLTPSLVSMVKNRGAGVVGVYDPEDGSDAKRRLLECGISDVIEAEASPTEFLAKIGQTLDHRSNGPPADPRPSTEVLSIAITGPSAGVGMTEVAIALARSLSRRVGTVLVDLDQGWPSIAQRLDLPVHPNIRTALDHALHRPERLQTAVHAVEELMVVGGRADGGQGAAVSRHETVALLDAFGGFVEAVVADVGPARDVEGGLLREFDSVLVVGTATPVGIARLLRTGGQLRSLYPHVSLLVVVNMIDASSFRRSETLTELDRSLPDIPMIALPHDRRLGDAAWNGTLVSGRRYRRAVESMADVVVGALQ
jgi:MinD-like ATPase involved in chromosome partitioning or flagellar assembly